MALTPPSSHGSGGSGPPFVAPSGQDVILLEDSGTSTLISGGDSLQGVQVLSADGNSGMTVSTFLGAGLLGTVAPSTGSAATKVQGTNGHGVNIIGSGDSGNDLAGVFVQGASDEGIALQGTGAAGVGMYAVLLGSTGGAVIQSESTDAGPGLTLELNGAGTGIADLLLQLNGTGLFVIANLPAADPHVAGAVYSGAAGALFVSAG